MLTQLLFVLDITCKFFILCLAKLFVSYIIINRPVFLCCHGIVLWSHTSCLNAILYWLCFESNLFKTFCFIWNLVCKLWRLNLFKVVGRHLTIVAYIFVANICLFWKVCNSKLYLICVVVSSWWVLRLFYVLIFVDYW